MTPPISGEHNSGLGVQWMSTFPLLQASKISIPRLSVLHLLHEFLLLKWKFVTLPVSPHLFLVGDTFVASKLTTFHQLLEFLTRCPRFPSLYLCYTSTLWPTCWNKWPISGSFHITESAKRPHHKRWCLLQIQTKHLFLYNTQHLPQFLLFQRYEIKAARTVWQRRPRLGISVEIKSLPRNRASTSPSSEMLTNSNPWSPRLVLEIMPIHAKKTAPALQSIQYKCTIKDDTWKHRDGGNPTCQSVYYNDSTNLGTSPLGSIQWFN